MNATELNSAAAVVDALGGISAVATLTGRNYKAAAMWKSLNKFPANTYLILTKALADKGESAPIELWGMAPALENDNPSTEQGAA